MLTHATALKKLTSKPRFQASMLPSATRVTGSKVPWFKTRPSICPPASVEETVRSAIAASLRSAAITRTCCGYFDLSSWRGASLRASKITLWEASIRYRATASPMPEHPSMRNPTMNLVPTSGSSGHDDSLGHCDGHWDRTASTLGCGDWRFDSCCWKDVLHSNVIARGRWGSPLGEWGEEIWGRG